MVLNEFKGCNSNIFSHRITDTVVPVMSGHPRRCPYTAGVPPSEGHFNGKQQKRFLKNAMLTSQMTEFGVPSSQGPL
jgi:hypothetical protein